MFSFFTIMLGILLLGHAVAYLVFVALFRDFANQHLFPIRSIFILLAVSFVGATFLVREYDSIITQIFYTLAASWVGFLLYIVIAGILFFLIWLVSHFAFPGVSIVWIGKILLAIALLVGVYGVYNANTIRVTEYTISLPGLPESWKGRKAVFVSDMHLGPVRREKFADKVARKINELNPDIVFDAGDLYDGGTGNAARMIEPLRGINAPLGYYFVTGNHEEYGDTSVYKNAISNTGIVILDDQAVEVEGVRIIGAEYSTTRNAQSLQYVLDRIPAENEMPTILIKHVPFDLDVAESNGINLQLSGHTHRAQVWPMMYITRAVYKGYDYGLKNLGALQVLVTDGVGTWGPPLRVGTNSELVLIRFE
ncbi:MAG TPA: metallophosphoesterase [Candidatus Paceibacterota bacterium]|nr:metallophosphoesterase [Candidatus Paceibacterota bacterium]